MTDRLDEIRARLDGATPGPWSTEPDTRAGRVWVQLGVRGTGGDFEPLFNVRSGPRYGPSPERESLFRQRAADAAFVAAAPGDISFLLGEVERLTAEPRDVELLVLREQSRSEAVRGNEAEAEAAELRAEIDRLTAERDGIAERIEAAIKAKIVVVPTVALRSSKTATMWRMAARNSAIHDCAEVARSFIPQTGDQA